jgi:hypothetical protein
LATPHHGTIIASDLDFLGQLTSLYWDRYDGADEAQNGWLRCLNGLDPVTDAGCSAFPATDERRLAALPKLVAVGLTWRELGG